MDKILNYNFKWIFIMGLFFIIGLFLLLFKQTKKAFVCIFTSMLLFLFVDFYNRIKIFLFVVSMILCVKILIEYIKKKNINIKLIIVSLISLFFAFTYKVPITMHNVWFQPHFKGEVIEINYNVIKVRALESNDEIGIIKNIIYTVTKEPKLKDSSEPDSVGQIIKIFFAGNFNETKQSIDEVYAYLIE